MKYDFDALVNIWEYDSQNYPDLCNAISDKVEEPGNTDFKNLTYAQAYSLMKHPNDYVMAALDNSMNRPLIFQGVLVSVSSNKSGDTLFATLADKTKFDESITSEAERIRYYRNHRDLADVLFQVIVFDETSMEFVADAEFGSLVNVAAIGVDCNIIPNTIVGICVDMMFDQGDCFYFGNDFRLHYPYDYYYRYYELRTQLKDYAANKGGKSSEESLRSAWNSFVSEIRAENEKEKREEYLKNKKLLDPNKTRQDYEQLKEEASKRYNEANQSYISLLDDYIANGTEEEKVHANSLKTEEKLLIWLKILAFIFGIGTFCSFGAEHFLTLVIWAAALIVNVVFVCRVKKKADNARKYFADKDERIEKLHSKSEKASEDSMQADKTLEIYEKVEKYERKHK